MMIDAPVRLTPYALDNFDTVEAFYQDVLAQPPAVSYIFDMKHINFITPYGVIALVLTARTLSARSGTSVILTRLNDSVHHYLQRMDVFDVGRGWLYPDSTIDQAWYRNAATPNLLELTPITSAQDVEAVTARADHIFQRWLHPSDLRTLLSVLSEVCANIYQHSGDQFGCVVIQKHEIGREAVITIAVGDLGCGVQGSLYARHGVLGDAPLAYLREALKGRTARISGRGGLGLRSVEQVVGRTAGFLWLRSETAALLRQATRNSIEQEDLADMPGTQLVVQLRAPLQGLTYI